MKAKVTFFSPWETNAADVRNMKHLPKRLIDSLKVRKVEMFDVEEVSTLSHVKNVKLYKDKS